MKFNNALFIHSHRFQYGRDGKVYSKGQFPYEVIKNRYLPYCTEIVMAARGEQLDASKNLSLSSGPNVRHSKLPNLSTIKYRRKRIKELDHQLYHLIEKADILIARMPSTYAIHAIQIAKKLGKPYVTEVVGDVLNSLWTHGSIYGKILAPFSYLKSRRMIRNAPYLIYVTKEHLQKRYPHNENALSIHASNVELPTTKKKVLEKRIDKIKNLDKRKEVKIGLIGNYSSKYKGIDTAIKSLKNIIEKGFNCKLYVLGSGENQWLLDLSKRLGIKDRVIFVGILPGGEEVLKWLDTLDIYIQPSLTEGLPRALIEAMSRGLPCVGSSVGGIPELLDSQFIHKPKSDSELSQKLEKLLLNKNKMLEQAKINFNSSKEYTSEVLDARRKHFWSKVISKELVK